MANTSLPTSAEPQGDDSSSTWSADVATAPAQWPAFAILRNVVAVVTTVVLVASLAIEFAATLSRYFFDHPLAWADEVAGALLVTTAFLGGALALARDEHLGVIAIRGRLRGRLAAVNESLIAWIVVIVSVAMCFSSVPIMQSVIGQTTATGLPQVIYYSPLLVGGALMALFALAGLARTGWRPAATAGAVLLALVGIWSLWGLLAPATRPLPIALLLIGFACTLLIGVPIAFALAFGALLFFWTGGGLPMALFVQQMESGVSDVVLLAIPFFVLAGLVMDVNGMSKRLIDLLLLLVGRYRGGLRLVIIAAMGLFSGISGSKSADVAAVGTTMLPAIRRAGQDDRDAVALLAATAVMGETIPPCINMIILGYVANLSVGGLFVAGVVPAGVIAVALAVVAVLAAPKARAAIRAAQHTEASRAAQDADAASSADPQPASEAAESGNPVRRSRSELLRLAAGAGAGLGMIVIIFGGILGGVATPTEVSAFAVVYALVVGGLAFREMTVRSTASFFVRSGSLAGMILFIIAAAQAVTYVLTAEQIPQTLANALVGISHASGTWAFLLLSIATLVVMGSVLEGAPALIIFGPLLLPIAADLHINPLHFGIVLIIAMGLGLFSPPFGLGLYTACAVGGVPMEKVARPIAKYLIVILLALLLIAFIPWLTLALPHAVGLG